MKFNWNNAKNSGIHEASIQLGREDCMVWYYPKNMEWIFFWPSNPSKNNKRLPSVSDLQDHIFWFFSFFFFNVKNWILRGFLRTNLNQRWLLKRLNIPQLHLFENLLCEHPLPSGPELVLWMISCAAISKQYSLVGFNKQDYVKPAI